ncbi:MAG TPA: cupin domain-containing protein, partial [Burkholderiales bacterium]
MKKTLMAVVALAAVAAAGFTIAQAPGLKRTELQDRDSSIPGKHVVQARVEFDPGAGVGRHTHPGDEISVVLEGSLLLEVDGQPARTIHAGEAFFVPAGTIHAGRIPGSG